MTTTATLPRPRQERFAAGAPLTVRHATCRDIDELLAMTDEAWPVLPLEPLGDTTRGDELPGLDGAHCWLLVALDETGRCLGLASYDRIDGAPAASFGVDVSPAAHGRGVAEALVRRLAAQAVRHGIAELSGWVSPELGRELLGDASAGCFHLATAGRRCLLVVRTTVAVER